MNRMQWRLIFLAILLGMLPGLVSVSRAEAPITGVEAKSAGFEKLWQLPVGISGYHSDSVARISQLGGNIYVLTRHGYMVAIRVKSGTIRWTIKLPANADSLSKPETFAKNQFMILTGGRMLIVDERTGTVVKSESLHFPNGSNPYLYGDNIFIGSLHDRMVAMSANWPPREVWFQLDSGDSFTATPVAVAGQLVFASRQGTIFSRSITDGTGGWKRPVGGHILASPAVAGTTVYFPCTDRNVYAIDAITGVSPWITHLPGSLVFTPVIIGKHLLVPSGGVGLFSLSMKTGLRQWGPVPQGFRVVGRKGDTIYVATTHGKIVLVSLVTGHVLGAMTYNLPSVFLRNSKTPVIIMASIYGDVEALKPLPNQ